MLRGLPVGGAHDHVFHRALDVPFVLAEIHGEVVEKLGMRRQGALQTEIFGGFHDTIAEELLPEAVHLHAGGERIFRSHRPLCEAKAVFWGVLRHRRESHRGRALAGAILERLVVGAAVEDIGLNGSRALFHDHHARGAVVEMVFEVVGAGEIEAGGGRLAGGVGLGGEVGIVHPILAVPILEQRQPILETVRVIRSGRPETVREGIRIGSFGSVELEFDDQLRALGGGDGGGELKEDGAVDAGDAKPPAIGGIGGLGGGEFGAEALEGRADRGDRQGFAFSALLDLELDVGQGLADGRQIKAEHGIDAVGLEIPDVVKRVHGIHPHGIHWRFRQTEFQGHLLAGNEWEDGMDGIEIRKKPLTVFRHIEVDGGQSTHAESIDVVRAGHFLGFLRGACSASGSENRPVDALAFIRHLDRLWGFVVARGLEGCKGHVDGIQHLLLALGRNMDERRKSPRTVAVLRFQPNFVNAVEIGHQAEEIILGNRVKFVVVATGTTDRHSHRCRAVGAHAVHGIFDEPLLRDCPSLVGDAVVAVKRGGELLVERGVREEIASQLLSEELVIGHVFIEGVDHPIAPRPARAEHFVVEGVAVAVAGDIEPIDRHAFAVVGRGQRAIHHDFVGFVGGVGHEGIDLLWRRRQAEEVHVHAADEGFLVGFGRGRDAFGLKLGEDEVVDRSARPGFVFHPWHGRLRGSDKCPVRLVFRTLADPLGDGGDLLLGERRLFPVRRRHDLVGIFGGDALEQEALLRLAGHDAVAGRLACLGKVGARVLLGIEAKWAGLVVRIRAVAGEAVVRKDRADLGAEGDFLKRGSCRGSCGLSGGGVGWCCGLCGLFFLQGIDGRLVGRFFARGQGKDQQTGKDRQSGFFDH